MRQLALAALIAAGPAAAQEIDLAVWALPEGIVVEAVTDYRLHTTWERRAPSRADTFAIANVYADTSRYTVERVAEGRPVALTWTKSGTETTQRFEDGRLVFEASSDPPVEGHAVRVERTAEGWRYESAGAPAKLASFLEALRGTAPDLLVPALDRTARVGEAWEVPLEVQRLSRPGLLSEPTPTFRVRLDSVGVWDGGPAAFLAFDGDQWAAFADDGTQRFESSGTYVHRLDLGLTAAVALEQTVTAEASGRFADGLPMRARFVSKRSGRFTRRVVPTPR